MNHALPAQKAASDPAPLSAAEIKKGPAGLAFLSDSQLLQRQPTLVTERSWVLCSACCLIGLFFAVGAFLVFILFLVSHGTESSTEGAATSPSVYALPHPSKARATQDVARPRNQTTTLQSLDVSERPANHTGTIDGVSEGRSFTTAVTDADTEQNEAVLLER